MMRFFLLPALLLALLAAPALAPLPMTALSLAQETFAQIPAESGQNSQNEASDPSPTLEKWGEANPDCLEWTNQCQICSRKDGAYVQCSLPGIACLPGPIMCKITRPKP